jgi:putative peptide zinc metalloprotease protein
MTTLIDSLVASTTRPVALRKRPDLLATQQQYHDGLFWVVKEPLSLQYFRMAEEEYALLELLDGRSSLEQLQEEFERRYAPQRMDFDGLCALIADFYSKGLVYSQAEGQGRELARRDRQSRLQQWKQRLTNPLSIRFRGVYPGHVLEYLYPRLRWMFEPWAVTCCLLVALMALALVAVKFDDFSARLPSFHQRKVIQNKPTIL